MAIEYVRDVGHRKLIALVIKSMLSVTWWSLM